MKPPDITAILPFCACLINQVQTGKKNTVGYRDPGIDPAVLNSQYTQTFLWLQQYDEGLLKEPEGQNGGTLAKPDDAMNLLFKLKDHRNGRLLSEAGQPVINDTGLAALTLLIAESDPKQKDTLIKLIMNLLCQNQQTK